MYPPYLVFPSFSFSFFFGILRYSLRVLRTAYRVTLPFLLFIFFFFSLLLFIFYFIPFFFFFAFLFLFFVIERTSLQTLPSFQAHVYKKYMPAASLFLRFIYIYIFLFFSFSFSLSLKTRELSRTPLAT